MYLGLSSNFLLVILLLEKCDFLHHHRTTKFMIIITILNSTVIHSSLLQITVLWGRVKYEVMKKNFVVDLDSKSLDLVV